MLKVWPWIKLSWYHVSNCRIQFSSSGYFFSELMKVTNYTGLWGFEFTWYSPSATHWNYLCGLEHSLEIHDFRPTWPCLILKVFCNLSKNSWRTTWILYCDQLNLHLLLHNKCFWLLPRHYGLVWTCNTDVPELDYFAWWSMWLVNCTTCQCTNYHYTIDHSLNCFSHVIYMFQISM